MTFTPEELEMVRGALVALQARQVSAFGAKDPGIDALVEKIDAPAPAPDPEPEPVPAKKAKK
jgi:hypothetical protein